MAETVVKETITRRHFLTRVVQGLAVVGIAEVGGIAVSFLKPRKPRVNGTSGGDLVEVGVVADFPVPSVTPSSRGHFYLLRMEDGGFLALSGRCTHLGCAVNWVAEENRFICPCHSSAFDHNGNVANAPAPRALDTYPVIIENGIVKVDTAVPMQRQRFNPTQVTHP